MGRCRDQTIRFLTRRGLVPFVHPSVPDEDTPVAQYYNKLTLVSPNVLLNCVEDYGNVVILHFEPPTL